MSSYTKIVFHVVFATKSRVPCLTRSNQNRLHRITWSILRDLECYPYAVNGTEDHLHIALSVPPKLALSDVVRRLKASTSQIIKKENWFPHFTGWQDGFGAFTISHSALPQLIDYIGNQQIHHQRNQTDFITEYRQLLRENAVDFNEEYLP